MSKNIKFFTLLFILFFFLTFEAAYAGKPPEFWIKNLEGERFRSTEQKSPYVISLFYVKCKPCEKEIPDLYRFMSNNFPNIPLIFMDPIKDDSKKTIKNFSKKLNVPLSYFYKDSLGTISKKFFSKGRMSFPTIIGIEGSKYIFRYNKIDKKILSQIKSLL